MEYVEYRRNVLCCATLLSVVLIHEMMLKGIVTFAQLHVFMESMFYMKKISGTLVILSMGMMSKNCYRLSRELVGGGRDCSYNGDR